LILQCTFVTELHKKDQAGKQGRPDHNIDLMGIELNKVPSLTEVHPAGKEERIPQGRTGKGRHEERKKPHLTSPCGYGDKMSHNGYEPADEKSQGPLAAAEKILCPLKVVRVEKQVSANLEHKRLTSVVAHRIRDCGPNYRTGAGCNNGGPEIPFAIGNQKPYERHHRLAWNRNDHALERHQEGRAEIPCPMKTRYCEIRYQVCQHAILSSSKIDPDAADGLGT